MNKKLIIAVALVVALALGGTLVYAAVDENGNWVNPFANILSGKVEDGTITQEEAATFAKVWEAIKGDMEEGGKAGFAGKTCKPAGRPEINAQFMEEYKAVFKEKADEIKNSLIEEGIIDADTPKGNQKDMDEETLAAIKEAMAAVKDYMNEFVESKVADGTITREEADMLLKMGNGKPIGPGGRIKGGIPGRRMPGGFKGPCETEDDPDA